ncbi:MAG: hypothetical protein QOJ23_903 [Actinomycetota bacterium]|jgi:signal transduction histidine kinase|nr:hypothetical protein [Actinomycetota bacterium]
MVKGGLTRRTVIASSLLVIIVGGAFAALILSIADLRDSGRMTRHSRRELTVVTSLRKLLTDIETGQRAFVITREERLLEPWEAARTHFPDEASRLTRLANDPEQASRARRIAQAGTAYIAEYSVPLVNAVRRNDDSSRTLAATDDGVRRFDALRDELDLYETTERATITNRLDDADADSALAIMAATSGFVGSILLIVLFAGYLRRTIVRPLHRAAIMAGELAGGDLTVRMPETGAGEIGVLARAFNTMASSLEVSRAELAASRSRVVVAADETRRRIERDLHDGTQQRLVSLALELRAAEATVPPELEELKAKLSDATRSLAGAVEDLQEFSRGIHPAILSKGGLAPALKALARRSAVPAQLSVHAERRPPERVEAAAYYVVSEALTNAAKHSQASLVQVDLETKDGIVQLSIRDDGVGGADPGQGSGLIGLRDRIEALGGKIEITSPAGKGTSLLVTIPIEEVP